MRPLSKTLYKKSKRFFSSKSKFILIVDPRYNSEYQDSPRGSDYDSDYARRDSRSRSRSREHRNRDRHRDYDSHRSSDYRRSRDRRSSSGSRWERKSEERKLHDRDRSYRENDRDSVDRYEAL